MQVFFIILHRSTNNKDTEKSDTLAQAEPIHRHAGISFKGEVIEVHQRKKQPLEVQPYCNRNKS